MPTAPSQITMMFLCGLGFLLGVVIFLSGLRRRLVVATPEPDPIPPPPEVIRLSFPSVPLKTSEMTQQQKIAAALMRAGMSTPSPWSTTGVTTADPESPSASSVTAPTSDKGNGRVSSSAAEAVLTSPFVLMDDANEDSISHDGNGRLASSTLKSTLFIWAGFILACISLYFFLKLENLV